MGIVRSGGSNISPISSAGRNITPIRDPRRSNITPIQDTRTQPQIVLNLGGSQDTRSDTSTPRVSGIPNNRNDMAQGGALTIDPNTGSLTLQFNADDLLNNMNNQPQQSPANRDNESPLAQQVQTNQSNDTGVTEQNTSLFAMVEELLSNKIGEFFQSFMENIKTADAEGKNIFDIMLGDNSALTTNEASGMRNEKSSPDQQKSQRNRARLGQ